MNKYIRKTKILEYIKEKKLVPIEDLRKKFEVSLPTIHRDLDLLVKEGNISKAHGRVSVAAEKDYYTTRIHVNVELKRNIANKALEYINNGESLFLDNSTTVHYLAEALCNSTKKDILIISNNASIAELFLRNKNINLFLLGGHYNRDINCFMDPLILKILEKFNADKFFFSCDAISLTNGIGTIYTPNLLEIKNKMLMKSGSSFLLIDSTKFEKNSIFRWLELKSIDNIITDNKIPETYLELYKNNEINLIL